jgi:hypothetical protein
VSTRSRRRGRKTFRYRLIDLSGYELGTTEREQPLRAGEHVDLPPPFEAVRSRVVSVLGVCAVVTRAQEAAVEIPEAPPKRR